MKNLLLCLSLILVSLISAQEKIKLTSDAFGSIEARHIGPAVMSGRVSAVDAVNKDPRIVYCGAASGGLWKSTNGGTTFKPVFDKYNQSIGSVTVDQKNPDIVWVGTGEVWVRNSVSVGDGIYKTTDKGETWKLMGLEKSERIAKIIVDPNNSDIVYAAAMGNLWNPSEDRGVYKTTDGGKSWEKVLYENPSTGCSDLAINYKNPQILYAAMWEFQRKPYTFNSGGPGSGLYKSVNGGITWSKITKGLPDSRLGRIAISVSPANPDIVYACIESEKSGFYRSKDKGETWELMSTANILGDRPFYFALIIADPVDTNRIYKPGFSMDVSLDGGKTWSSPFIEGGNVHSDLHALWIAPNNNSFMYLGTDGGLYLSMDRGSTWRFMENLPLSQFYHVSVDMMQPYNIYGGLQDNGSWIGLSQGVSNISNSDWQNIGYGDGFNVLPDRTDDNIIYWQYQGGNLQRFYKNTREIKEIKPYPDNPKEKLRFNWNAPVLFSPTQEKVIYVGAQYLFKTTDRGDTWGKISPDLTTNDPNKLQQEKSGGITIDNTTAENHCTIFTISESPVDKNIIWVGTDDGNLQVTSNGGKNWSNVVNNIPGLPKETWCSYVEASYYNKGTAYVIFDGHRNGDKNAYVFKTSDYGKSWITLSTSDIKGYCHVIKEDFINPDLIFLGTEFGLFVTLDGGKSWVQFTGKIPNVPILDIVIHPRDFDLILATHGRGILIIDDINPLRELNEEILNSELTVLSSKPSVITNPKNKQGWPGDQDFSGRNRTESPLITYYMSKRHVFGDMSIEIYNSKGEKLQTLSAGKKKGINRVPWYIRMKPPKVKASSPELASRTSTGPTYPAGEYIIKILKGDKSYSGKISLIYDIESTHSLADRDLQYNTLMKAYNLLEDISFLNLQTVKIKDAADALKNSVSGSLKKELEKLSEKMDKLHKELVATNPSRLSGEERLSEKVGEIYGAVVGYQGRPTSSQIEGLNSLEKEFLTKRKNMDEFLAKELSSLNEKIKMENLKEIKVLSLDEYKKM